MAGLLRADPGLPRRFPNQVHLIDYSPCELAQIAQTAARDRFNMKFEPGLQPALAEHIRRKHSRIIHQHNGGLSVNLTEEALGRLAQRCVDGNIFNEDTLRASDYGIGEYDASDGAPEEGGAWSQPEAMHTGVAPGLFNAMTSGGLMPKLMQVASYRMHFE